MMAKPVVARIRTWLTPLVRGMRRQYLRKVWGMDIGKGAQISMSARLDKTHPRGVHIGDETAINFEVAILTHDFVNRRHLEVRIGRQCLIGARSIVYPGVTIGDHCIVSAASVVMKDVPPHSLVAGNPARIIEKDIATGPLGHRINRDPPPSVIADPLEALRAVPAERRSFASVRS
ncbi:MAG: acyltransferase [Azospirillaceae bacterium]|nr:acyltransferase [Azospirillaceae bacterium]